MFCCLLCVNAVRNQQYAWVKKGKESVVAPKIIQISIIIKHAKFVFACLVDPTCERYHNTNPGGRLVIFKTHADEYAGDSHLDLLIEFSYKLILKIQPVVTKVLRSPKETAQ